MQNAIDDDHGNPVTSRRRRSIKEHGRDWRVRLSQSHQAMRKGFVENQATSNGQPWRLFMYKSEGARARIKDVATNGAIVKARLGRVQGFAK